MRITGDRQTGRLLGAQMILDLLLLGIGINVFVHVARLGRERQSNTDEVGL